MEEKIEYGTIVNQEPCQAMKSPAWFFFLAVESSQSVGSAVAQDTKGDEMKKLAEKEILLKTSITALPDGTRTYFLGKSLESLEGGKGIFVLLYPTRTMENLHVEDSTNVHLLNHMKELGLKEYGIVNLFSTVTQSKLSTRGLALDTENLNYIKESIFREIKSPADKVIIAWGNSHQTSQVVNRAKLEVLKMWEEIHGGGMLYQLTADGLDKENVGVHPLYMGIRYANALWKLEPYPAEKIRAELKAVVDAAKKIQREDVKEPSAEKSEKMEKIEKIKKMPTGRTASGKQAAEK